MTKKQYNTRNVRSRHGEEVERDDAFELAAKKRQPFLGRNDAPWNTPQVARAGPLGAEFLLPAAMALPELVKAFLFGTAPPDPLVALRLDEHVCRRSSTEIRRVLGRPGRCAS